jgi:hypothetical protein
MLVARYVRTFRELPRLSRPRTFNEKLLVKLLVDRDPKLTLFADKFAVRAHVAERLGGEQNLTTLYAAVDRPEEIRRINLPDRFIAKPNHLCREVRVVKDFAANHRLELEALANRWFQRNLFHELGEWAYRDIRSKVLFEELLEEEGHGPSDYRFHCFSGEPRLLLVTRDVHGPNASNTYYDAEFKVLPVRLVKTRSRHVTTQTAPPQNYGQMLDIARQLSKGTRFLRVDLYNIDGRIVFGELTNYPSGGVGKFVPAEFDRTLGSYWL